jgi:AbrB family looped-hinge helix DNA binding protein
MAKSTVTYKGQITLPKAVRERLGVGYGDRVSFRELPGGVMVIEADTVDLNDLAGAVRPRRSGVTLAEMDEVILRTATRKR